MCVRNRKGFVLVCGTAAYRFVLLNNNYGKMKVIK